MNKIFLAVLGLVACQNGPVNRIPTLKTEVSRFQITNKCNYDIWVQQQNFPDSPDVVNIKSGATVPYSIPDAGLAATRLWPKAHCNESGQNCKIGQSSPPCSSTGCAPPVDSKIEATWGCTLQDPSQCAKTPQGNLIDATTWWNASAVDGYTFPYTISVTGGDKRSACQPVDCSGLSFAGCPTDEDLSNNGANPKYAHENMKVVAQDGSQAGCFSTCMKLNYPGWGGVGLNDPAGSVEQMYCCPTPPISSPQCQAGPVVKTKYVNDVHSMCKHTVYGYAYDDGVGLRNCSADVEISMVIGPNCP